MASLPVPGSFRYLNAVLGDEGTEVLIEPRPRFLNEKRSSYCKYLASFNLLMRAKRNASTNITLRPFPDDPRQTEAVAARAMERSEPLCIYGGVYVRGRGDVAASVSPADSHHAISVGAGIGSGSDAIVSREIGNEANFINEPFGTMSSPNATFQRVEVKGEYHLVFVKLTRGVREGTPICICYKNDANIKGPKLTTLFATPNSWRIYHELFHQVSVTLAPISRTLWQVQL